MLKRKVRNSFGSSATGKSQRVRSRWNQKEDKKSQIGFLYNIGLKSGARSR